MAEAVTERPRYTVKAVEVIAEGSDVLVRLYTLALADVIPWHFHSQVTDRYYCLDGTLRIETRAPRADERVTAGGSYAIPPKTAHRISNGGSDDCRFLLVQGVGTYDFHKIGN